MNRPKGNTRWHRLLSKMLEELLTPVGITVITEFQIMTDPPEADILLLRRNKAFWSEKQLSLLPDGIRDTTADHILIEFKYTESVNRDALSQALAYDTFYKRTQKLDPGRIQTFLLSSRTPRRKFLETFGYEEKEKKGVYYSNNSMLDLMPIISLNELPDKPHNRFIKCFASRKKEKQQALKKILKSGGTFLNSPLQWLIAGLWKTFFNQGGNGMEIELTPEKVMEIGKLWSDASLEAYLDSLPVEKRLAGLKPKDRLAGLKPKEILDEFKPKDRLAGLKPIDRLAGLKPIDRLAGLTPEEIRDIETYLKKMKKKV